MSMPTGAVYLVGAGPGDPGLITVRGLALVRTADVIVYDRLAPADLLANARSDAELINVGKARGRAGSSQERINELLITGANDGKRVVRLKGGDPFVFGRGCEEVAACRAAGVPCYVVPGVSSALAAPASAGISLTDRRRSHAFAVMTGSLASHASGEGVDFASLAGVDSLAILMGRDNLAELAAGLIAAGRAPNTPVACIAWATTPRQRVLVSTLQRVGDLVSDFAGDDPVVTIVGEVSADAATDTQGRAIPLAHKRILVTRPSSADEPFANELLAAGAHVISCPLLAIEFPDAAPDLDEALQLIGSYDWLVFTSARGVQGFWRRLARRGMDVRSFAHLRFAAIGPTTAAALASWGIKSDVVSAPSTAQGLVRALAAEGVHDQRVLVPCSNIARRCVADGLLQKGARVTTVVVYRNEPAEPAPAAVAALEDGVDAIVFCSPSAATRFHDARLPIKDAVVVSIGPTTAAALSDCGLPVHVQANTPTPDGVVTALVQYMNEHERVS